MPDRHLLFSLMKKVNKTACRQSFSGGAKSSKNHPGLYPHGPQARGHFCGPSRFALS